jgi:hypothetical protein
MVLYITEGPINKYSSSFPGYSQTILEFFN